jgi:hypothetical protein
MYFIVVILEFELILDPARDTLYFDLESSLSPKRRKSDGTEYDEGKGKERQTTGEDINVSTPYMMSVTPCPCFIFKIAAPGIVQALSRLQM